MIPSNVPRAAYIVDKVRNVDKIHLRLTHIYLSMQHVKNKIPVSDLGLC